MADPVPPPAPPCYTNNEDIPSYLAAAATTTTPTASAASDTSRSGGGSSGSGAVLARGPTATGDAKPVAAPSKFYFQTEQKFPARQHQVVTFSADPALCRPVYTVKHHGQQRILSLASASSPDITLYRGADDDGQVVATASIKSPSLIGKKAIGEVKVFGAGVSGSGSGSGSGAGGGGVVQTTTLRNEGGRAVWEWRGLQLAWNVAVHTKPPANEADHCLGPPPPDPAAAPPDTSVKAKLRAAVDARPQLLFTAYSGVLEAEPGVELAVYHEISPHNPPMTRQLIYRDEHAAILEFKDSPLETAFLDVALAMLVLMVERAKRGVVNGKGGIGFTFNPWGGAIGVVGGGG